MKKIATIIVLLMMATAGCLQDRAAPESAYAPMPKAMDTTAAMESSGEITADQTAPKPKIIRTADVELDSDDLEADFAKIEARTVQLGGYVAGTEEDRRSELSRWGTLVVKVPSRHFDEYLNFLKGEFTIIQLRTHSEDVTEKYVDLEARLKNAKRQEDRLVKLLEAETGNLKEVLMVEQELARVREKIEGLEGKLRFLNNRLDLSTINIRLYQEKPIKSVKGSWIRELGSDLKETFAESIRLLGSSVRSLVLFLAAALPWAIAIGIVIFLFVRILRRKKQAKK